MDKQLIERFVKYYHLNGTIESSIVKQNDKETYVEAVSDCQSLATRINFKDVDVFPNSKIGIFDNNKLLNILGLFDNDGFSINFTDRSIDFKNENNSLNSRFILADTSVITDSSNILKRLNGVKDWQFSFNLDEEKINLILKSRKALSDAKKLYVNPNHLTITNDLNHNNKIDIEIESNIENADNNIFKLDHFDTVLSILDDNVKCYVHERGLLKLVYNDEDFNCNYYLMAISE